MPNESLNARGHKNVRCEHRGTLEFTAETHLTPRGDCIVAICADKTLGVLSHDFRQALKKEGSRLTIRIECGGACDTVRAFGHPGLVLDHPTDIVVRKGSQICPRTLAIGADKASSDLDRGLVERLKEGLPVTVTFSV